MVHEGDEISLADGFTGLAKTKAFLGKVPPNLLIATGHEDEVLMFLERIGDAEATMDTLRRIITVAETNEVLVTMARTGGLLNKRFPIDTAQRLKQRLEAAGTVVEFVRPDENVA